MLGTQDRWVYPVGFPLSTMPLRARKSPRWRRHDYRRTGLYFVTICTAKHRLVFGEVRDGEMVLSRLGEIAAQEWNQTLAKRETLVADAFVVMPNHVHALFGIVEDSLAEDTMHGVPTTLGGTREWNPADSLRQFGQHLAGSVSSIVGAYKAAVTRQARREGVWPEGALWQGRFHDHVVRSDDEAERIRRYIAENPARWNEDRFYPDPFSH